MSVADHLGELRRRVFIAVSAFSVAAVVAFVFYPSILHVLQDPYCHITTHCQLYVPARSTRFPFASRSPRTEASSCRCR